MRGFVGNQQQTARGETITYQLNYDNIGNATADDTIITDTLPE
ncbi:MAG: hypothetical protein H6766_05360 [Candidatus Peribacteria bacterium]|nr:MAG: hypothetical protein H6766_05360 [Candidatus Peribacteria bacterium]